jgi:hypothetical protein
MKTDRISFTSKINFVDSKTFEKFCRNGKFVDWGRKEKGIVIAPEIYTEEIRTCTAGGVIDSLRQMVAGFHYLDGIEEFSHLEDFVEGLFSVIKLPERALLIGGKYLKHAVYSLPNFYEMSNMIKARVPKTTIFGEHNLPWSESNFHYSLKTDTWTINSMYRSLTDCKEHQVLSKEDLYTAFKSIELAEGDTLFINGKQVFL